MARKRNPRVITAERLLEIGKIYKYLMFTWGQPRVEWDHTSNRAVRTPLQPEDDIAAWRALRHEMVHIVRIAEEVWAMADAEVRRLES